MWQPSCWKWEEKKKRENCGNEVAGNEGEKKRFRPKIEGKKNCDNWFVAMELPKWEEKKIVVVDLWQCCYRNGRKKNVAMELLKWEEKKLWQWSCQKLEERERERERENCLDKKKIFGGVNHLTSSSDSYSPSTSEYIVWSFPIKPKLLIWIYVMDSFLSFHFSPRYKSQAPSLKYCISYIFHIASLTVDCLVLYYPSALLQCAQLRIVRFGLIWVFLLCF